MRPGKRAPNRLVSGHKRYEKRNFNIWCLQIFSFFLLVQGNIFLCCYLPSRIDLFRDKIGCTLVEASHRRLRSSVVIARGIQKQKTASHRKRIVRFFWYLFVSWLLIFWLVEFWTLNTLPVSYLCKFFKRYWSYNVSMNYTQSQAPWSLFLIWFRYNFWHHLSMSPSLGKSDHNHRTSPG